MPGSAPLSLTTVFVLWAAACLGLGAMSLRRAPVVSLALGGSLLGAVAGFGYGNADGPAEVPAYTAVGASFGLFAIGLLGLLTTSPGASARWLRRAGLLVLLLAPVVAGALTMLLQLACPLYVSGRRAGFCNYQGGDVLGGWVSGVVIAFLVDAAFVSGLFFVSARQVRVSDAGDVVEGGAPRPQPTRLF